MYYIGIKANEGIGGQAILRVDEEDTREGGIAISPRNDIYNHSPDGMNWGYGGSGAAQAAIGILADYSDDATALKYHQDFKWDFISSQGDKLYIKGKDITGWLARKILNERK